MAKDKAISFRVSQDFLDILDRLKQKTNKPQTTIIEEALVHYLKLITNEIDEKSALADLKGYQSLIAQLVGRLEADTKKRDEETAHIRTLCLQILANQQSGK
jgi:predicted DNA-binding protein